MSILSEQNILDTLAKHDAVLTNRHFVYTSGLHGTAYANMRAVAHLSGFMADIGITLAARLSLNEHQPDVILGPETLGRTLAGHAAGFFGSVPGIWCDMVGEGKDKRAVFNRKLDFGRLITTDARVAIVDDLLTTGSSIKLAAELVESLGGIPVVAAVVARRSQQVSYADCGTYELEVLAEIKGFNTFTPAECKERGPCSKRVPVTLLPGHGHEWVKEPENRDYPVAD